MFLEPKRKQELISNQHINVAPMLNRCHLKALFKKMVSGLHLYSTLLSFNLIFIKQLM